MKNRIRQNLGLPLMSVMAVVNLFLLVLISEPAFSDDRFGNRHEPYSNFVSESEKLVAQSVAAVVLRNKIERMPNSNGQASRSQSRLKVRSAKERYNLCSEEAFSEQSSAAMCTAFLVSDDLVVTAGHCIRTYYACRNLAFVFDYSMKNESTNTNIIQTKDIYSCDHVVVNGLDNEFPSDFAIVKLNRKVRGRTPLKIRRHGLVEDNARISMMGHPLGVPTKITRHGGIDSNLDSRYFTSDIDSYVGNSGSPVANRAGLVEGILVRGKNSFISNGNCRRTRACEDSDCRSSDVVRTTEIAPYIPTLGHSLKINEALVQAEISENQNSTTSNFHISENRFYSSFDNHFDNSNNNIYASQTFHFQTRKLSITIKNNGTKHVRNATIVITTSTPGVSLQNSSFRLDRLYRTMSFKAEGLILDFDETVTIPDKISLSMATKLDDGTIFSSRPTLIELKSE